VQGLQEQGKELLASPVRRAALYSLHQMRAGHFRFLFHEARFVGGPDWGYEGGGRLWRFHLHSFEYLRHLLVASLDDPECAFRLFKRLVDSWIEGNRVVDGDGWHPFTISNRTVEWILAACHFAPRLEEDQEFTRVLLASLFEQVRFLNRNLERDVGGNHLIKNLKALVWAGLLFEGREARQWLDRGLSGLEEEMHEQLLGDGAHFERNPGYHVQVLCDLLETGLCLRLNRGESPSWLEKSVDRMAEWLRQILPDSGSLPRFKDTTQSPLQDATDVLKAASIFCSKSVPSFRRSREIYSGLLFGRGGISKTGRGARTGSSRAMRRLPARWLSESGYLVLRDSGYGDFLMMDAGKVCPDTLPAHAHADLFSFELTLSDVPVVVDPGVFTYEGGEWRDFFRSTAAHNTVEVERADQSEVWDRFRVARRARVVRTICQETDSGLLFQAWHDGYQRLEPPVMHCRTLLWHRSRRIWAVVDRLNGAGSVEASNRVHFHPLIKPTNSGRGGRAWQIPVCSENAWLIFLGEGSHQSSRGERGPRPQGWYSPRMGRLVPSTVLAWKFAGELPLTVGYVISKESVLETRWQESATELRLEIDLESGTIGWTIDFGS